MRKRREEGRAVSCMCHCKNSIHSKSIHAPNVTTLWPYLPSLSRTAVYICVTETFRPPGSKFIFRLLQFLLQVFYILSFSNGGRLTSYHFPYG